jgi:hypothetical protein
MLEMSNTLPSIRRFDRRLSRLACAWGFCFFATLASVPAVAATSVEVTRASIALDDGVYELDVDLGLNLPGGARRAIEAGLTLRLDYEIEIARVRRYLPDPDVASLLQSFELGYHALSQRYLLRNRNTGEQQDFGALSSALDRMATVRGLPLIDAALLDPGTTYEIRVRADLRLRSAPDTFGWLLFWTEDWSATSEWYAWTHRP